MSETEKELDKLKELLDIGFIQEEEYNRRKAEIITLTEERRATVKGSSSVVTLFILTESLHTQSHNHLDEPKNTVKMSRLNFCHNITCEAQLAKSEQ
jgi:hypothetical protein